MTHEAGIEAAMNRYDEFFSQTSPPRNATSDIIQAYLSASGMVLVPKRPDEKMIAEAWSSWKSRHPKPIGPGPGFVEAISAAISTAPAGLACGWLLGAGMFAWWFAQMFHNSDL